MKDIKRYEIKRLFEELPYGWSHCDRVVLASAFESLQAQLSESEENFEALRELSEQLNAENSALEAKIKKLEKEVLRQKANATVDADEVQDAIMLAHSKGYSQGIADAVYDYLKERER